MSSTARTVAALLALAGAYACSTGNGDPEPEQPFDGPSLDAGSNVLPDVDARDAATSTDAEKPDATADGGDAGDALDPSLVRINEVYVDTASDGDKVEFVELRGNPGTPLGELRLRLLDSTGAVSGEIDIWNDPTDKMPSRGLWVVGGAFVSTIDPDAGASAVNREMTGSALNLWGMETPRGAVQLVRGASRTLVDVVGYDSDADAGALPAPASPPLATSEGKPAVLATAGKKSLGRANGAADTNDNRVDFCKMSPTAGRAQAACE